MEQQENVKKRAIFKKLRKLRALALVFLLVFMISGAVTTFCGSKKSAEAVFCTPCILCFPGDSLVAVVIMNGFESALWSDVVRKSINRHVNSEQNYIVKDFFRKFFLRGVSEMTIFLANFGMYQVEVVGTFFDAKNQLETTRLLFKLQAQAHKDYQPSEELCWFGTNVRSLAASENQSKITMVAMSRDNIVRQLGVVGSSAASGQSSELKSRWDQFVKTYCDPKDNGWSGAGTGLDFACDRDGLGPSASAGADDISRVNKDIDYTALIDAPRTLDIDFFERSRDDSNTGTGSATATFSDNEEDVLAMSKNLYGHQLPSRGFSAAMFANKGTRDSALNLYMQQRSMVARRNVAQSSFNTLVSMKSEGSNGDWLAANKPKVGATMGALLKDLVPSGTTEEEILAMIGENPSYYAQLEFLSKRIYQDPKFFVNLYDTPANIERKSVAMKAIGLMLDRALFESELRQEMLLSVMLSNELRKSQRDVSFGASEAN